MKMRLTTHVFLLGMLLVLSLLASNSPAASAAPTAAFTITNLNNSGVGSLRWAINQVNLANVPSTIDFGVSGTITLAWTLPQILVDTTITGPAGGITINGNGNRAFFIGNSWATLALSNLTITNGFNPDYLGGGAIYNLGTLNLNNCTLYGNSAIKHGGAIFNDAGNVNITNSTIRDNTAGYFGGGIFTSGGNVYVSGSTLSGNNAWVGGGMYLNGSSAFVSTTNSTFSGNTAVASVGGNGGAIYVDQGSLNANYSTIASNNATLTGGIVNNNGWVYLANSIIANNTVGGNCSGVINGLDTLQYNPNSGCVGTSGDPKLGPLADNGGPTKTMALQAGSAAINKSPSYYLTTDQRGFTRNMSDFLSDVGAYEYGAKGTTTLVMTPPPSPSFYGQSVTFIATIASPSGGKPTGSVTFTEGATTLGTGTLNNNVATFTTSLLSVGAHTIGASYDGNANYSASTSTSVPHTVIARLLLPFIKR